MKILVALGDSLHSRTVQNSRGSLSLEKLSDSHNYYYSTTLVQYYSRGQSVVLDTILHLDVLREALGNFVLTAPDTANPSFEPYCAEL